MAATVSVGAGEGAALVGGATSTDAMVGTGRAGFDVVVTDGIGVNTNAMGFVVDVAG
jgi:hypothetical protein